MHSMFLELFMRWLHIAGACVLVGSPIFMRLFLWPAMDNLDAGARQVVIDRMNKSWRKFLGAVILTQIVSGVYWLLVVVDMQREPAIYQILLTIKLLAALALFFLLSVLAGRATAFELFRIQARKWLAVCTLLGLIIVVCAGAMRLTPLKHRPLMRFQPHASTSGGSATTKMP